MKLIMLVMLLTFNTLSYAFEGCYESITDFEGNHNVWTICKDSNDSATIEIFFSNNLTSSEPAICRQSATYRLQKDNLLIKGKRGECDNGRYLVPHNLACKRDDVAFRCYLQNYTYEMKFIKNKRARQAPALPLIKK